ncbi:MAG TPA: GNAT family N-acetyltransferase [Ignavibacteriaceae bacterium]|nr:GNAT family N-acetyltransferase [Ignavibacteriaceae bacterium]
MQEQKYNDYVISNDRKKLNLQTIYNYISLESYWGKGRSKEVIKRSIDNSLPFGIYYKNEMIGFARVVTDYATFAWIADVFILQEHRGKGLSKWLMEVMLAHPQLQGFRRWVLATKDAHELYRKYGFQSLKRADRWMERFDPDMKETPDYWKKD